MLVLIRDRYYRDSPESVMLSAFVSERDSCRFTCTISFKAGHAPEETGDRSRPPQTLQLGCSSERLTQWLMTDHHTPLKDDTDLLQALLEEDVSLSASSRRWKGLSLEVKSVTRHAFELEVVQQDGKEVMTVYWPVGVFSDMRRAMSKIKGKRGHTGLVVSWNCAPYGYSLDAIAQTLD